MWGTNELKKNLLMQRAQAAVARGLTSLGVEFSEEAVEPVTGSRVDMMLHSCGGRQMEHCALEVGNGGLFCWWG